MSASTPYFRTQFLTSLRPGWPILVLFLACCVPAMGDETKPKTELAERKAFIDKAMDEQREKAKEEIAKLARSGIYADMVVATLQPFGDWDFYFVHGGSISWRPNAGQKFQPVEVPEGFVTDLASIPRLFWQVLRPEGRYAYAAVVHDYLYWKQTRPRAEADQIFRIAMEDSKVDPKLVDKVYRAVRTFGQAAWDNNARLKKAGERRILKRFPQDYTTSWSEWKKQPDVFAEE